MENKSTVPDNTGGTTEIQEQRDPREVSASLYYSQRLAYNPNDTRQPIGRYNSRGEVELFKPWAQ
jgi:hypothetical protein